MESGLVVRRAMEMQGVRARPGWWSSGLAGWNGRSREWRRYTSPQREGHAVDVCG